MEVIGLFLQSCHIQALLLVDLIYYFYVLPSHAVSLLGKAKAIDRTSSYLITMFRLISNFQGVSKTLKCVQETDLIGPGEL